MIGPKNNAAGRLARARLLLSALLLGAGLLWPAPAGLATDGPRGLETTPLDVVIATDESGSLTPDDVRREIDATSTIAQAGLNPRSRVTVLGFGSNNGGGQQAVHVYCPPTVLSGAVEMQRVADCVKKIHRRSVQEGNDTDHVAALAQALHTLESGSPKGARKVVFLLTDGRLDVSRSPQYGNGDRNLAAQRELDQQLMIARTAGVQIFPLGFGARVDKPSLDRFATGGSQQGCDKRPESRPAAHIVHDSRDVLRALAELYATAFCGRVSPPAIGSVPSGGSVQLKVTIPAIATDGVITVAKGDPRVRVDYIDPHGATAPSGGTRDDSTFTRSGENSTTEALRIVNPVNGTWRLRLTAPNGLDERLVSATAIWQGAVRSAILVEPPGARTGERVVVRLSLQTRKGAVTDAASLRDLDFAVTATGATLGGPKRVEMRDDGKAPDDKADDGRYAGTFTTPPQPGDVTFLGDVSGPGLRAEQVPVTLTVGAESPSLLGRVEFGGGAAVNPGKAVRGTVTVKNDTGRTVRARLMLDGPPQTRAAVSPGGGFAVPPGASTHDFTVPFGKDAALGGTSLTVRLVDEADLSKVYANGQLTVTIENPPGWIDHNGWAVTGAIFLLVLALAAGLTKRRAVRAERDVRGLRASLLRRDGVQLGPPLKAPGIWSDKFRFAIRDAGGSKPRLDRPGSRDRAYTAWRRRDGRVGVRGPDGTTWQIELNGAGEPVADGLLLTFHDVRKHHRPAPRRGRGRGRGGSSGRGSVRKGPTGPRQNEPSLNGADRTGVRPSSPASPPHDPWL